jgi:hypothetical protein
MTVGLLLMDSSREPNVILLPLFGLCPFQMESGQPGYNPSLGYLWGIFAGLVFLALALYGWVRNSKWASVGFAALFLISSLVMLGRIARFFSGIE